MTDTETTADTWTQQLALLKARYKHVREPILVALNILVHEPNIALEDAKAKAVAHGIRITAASVSAARTLLLKMDVEPAATAPLANGHAPARPRPAGRGRIADGGVDADALIRQVVAKLQNQSNAEAEQVCDGIRRAITILQGLVGASS